MPKAIFDESPAPTDKHVLNYLELLGSILRNYRKTYPIAAYRSIERFTECKLSPYYSKGACRKTLGKAEAGKPTVAIGTYAAVLHEMGLWPAIINALGSSTAEDVRYVEIVINELRKKEKEKYVERMKKLNKNFFNEVG